MGFGAGAAPSDLFDPSSRSTTGTTSKPDPNNPGFDTEGHPLDDKGQVNANENLEYQMSPYKQGQAESESDSDAITQSGAFMQPQGNIDPTTGKVANYNSPSDYSWMQKQQGISQANQSQAWADQNNLAHGKGPSLATSLLNQQANRSIANTNAQASSGSGNQSAMARRQAMMQGAATMQDLGDQAGSARAQEQLGAMNQEGTIAGQARAQDQALSGQQQQSLEDQQNMQLKQYDSSTANNLAQQKQDMAGTNSTFDNTQKTVSMVGSLVGMFSNPDAKKDIHAADLHLTEPSKSSGTGTEDGGAHWIIREEPDFLLAANARTGEMRKIMTQPLSPQEHTQASKKHGAGPLGSDNPGNKYVHDLNLGGADASGGMGAMGGSYASPQSSTAKDKSGDDYAQLHKDISSYLASADVDPSKDDSSSKPASSSSSSSSGGGMQSMMGGMMGGGGSGGTMADGHGMSSMGAADLVLGGPRSPQSAPPAGQKQMPSQASPSAQRAQWDTTTPQETEVDKFIRQSSMGKGYNGYNPQNMKAAAGPQETDYSGMSNRDVGEAMAQQGIEDQSVDTYRTLHSEEPKYAAKKGRATESPDIHMQEKGRIPNLDYGGPTKVDDEGNEVQELPEEEITPEPEKKKSSYDTVAADLHLGGSKMGTVENTGVKAPKASSDSETVGGALRKLSPYTYRYKNSAKQPSQSSAGSKYFGVMTTDLKKNPVTKNMVSGKGDNEQVAIPAATSFNLAGNAHLQKTTDNHERRLSMLEKAFSGKHLKRSI